MGVKASAVQIASFERKARRLELTVEAPSRCVILEALASSVLRVCDKQSREFFKFNPEAESWIIPNFRLGQTKPSSELLCL